MSDAIEASGGGRGRWLLVVVVALIAFAILHVDSYTASDLRVVPDSVEYAVGAHRLVSEGRYDLVIEGVSYPPRYEPWFSALFLAPAIGLADGDLGAAIYPVTLLAVLGVVLVFLLGSRGVNPWGGVIAVGVLLGAGKYLLLAREVMTDVPATTFVLLAAWAFVCIHESGAGKAWLWLAGGVATALAAALRPLLAWLWLPFIVAVFWSRTERRWKRLGLVLLPAVVLTLAQVIYREATFGSPWCSGYAFWCPQFLSQRGAVVGAEYFRGNALRLLGSGGLGVAFALAAAGWFICRAGSEVEQKDAMVPRLWLFATLGVGPTLLVHLFFFYPSGRFAIPILALLSALVGRPFSRLFRNMPASPAVMIVVLGLMGLIGWSRTQPEPIPMRRMAADVLRESTPEDALILTALDPVYLDPLVLRGTRRRVMPLSRDVEYASKLVSREKLRLKEACRISDPREVWWPVLREAGAQKVVDRVALNNVGFVVDEVRGGLPVYLDLSHVQDPQSIRAVRALSRKLLLRPAGPWLFRLELPEVAAGS